VGIAPLLSDTIAQDAGYLPDRAKIGTAQHWLLKDPARKPCPWTPTTSSVPTATRYATALSLFELASANTQPKLVGVTVYPKRRELPRWRPVLRPLYLKQETAKFYWLMSILAGACHPFFRGKPAHS